jgi:uncharacterized protein
MPPDERDEMKLSKLERLMLSNQLKILEKLYPEEASSYAEKRKAIEYGFALHFPWLMDHIYDEMTVEECKEVLDILEMFSAIKRSYDNLKDKEGIKEDLIRFAGFDGNNEGAQMVYTRYFIVDLDRYVELRYDADYPDFNSHYPSLDRYLTMTAIWKKCKDKYKLSKEEILELLEA